jgi:Uma2 family endonuclease
MEMLSPDAELLEKESIRPLKRVEYERLATEGFFEEEKVELLFGVVVMMSPRDPAHNMAIYQARRLLEAALGDRAAVLSQSSFAATEDSAPEPDVFVVPNSERSWTEHPARSHLVLEVARTSLERDQGPKSILYGASQVEEYWIVNLPEDVVEVYREPNRGRWRSRRIYRRGERIQLLAFPDISLAVDELLPPPGSGESW